MDHMSDLRCVERGDSQGVRADRARLVAEYLERWNLVAVDSFSNPGPTYVGWPQPVGERGNSSDHGSKQARGPFLEALDSRREKLFAVYDYICTPAQWDACWVHTDESLQSLRVSDHLCLRATARTNLSDTGCSPANCAPQNPCPPPCMADGGPGRGE